MKAFIEHRFAFLLQHRALAAGLLAAAIAAIGIAVVAQRDTRAALFARALDAEQVSEVVTQLAVWNVPFIASADNVQVEASRRGELLLRLSLMGIPHAHVMTSHEVLAGAGPLTPQSVLDEQRLDGLAGDLALDLRGIAGISDAHVVIAPAKAGVFADDPAHPASAAVRLTMQPGVKLTSAQIASIRSFIASGVPGLEAERVSILDDRGVALGEEGAIDETETLQASLQSALDAALGAGATIVRVRAIYDAQAREVREVKREPLESAAIGTSTFEERFTDGRKRYGKTQSQADRGSDVWDEKTEVPAGRLLRLSVAIMVDEQRRLDLVKLRDLAAAVVGLMPQRGDTLSVQTLAFAKPAPRRVSPWLASLGLLSTALPTAIIAACGLIALKWSAKPLARGIEAWRHRAALARAGGMAAGFAPAQVRGALHGEPPHTAAAIISALPTATATAVLEMYPPEERAAIVRRMQRSVAPVVPDYQTVVRRG